MTKDILYTVIRDTREKENQGWVFNLDAREKKYLCQGTEQSKLDTGDYTVTGYEDVLCIERKGSVSEWSKNITEKRFRRELDRMLNFPYSFILLEFTLEDLLKYPSGTRIPRKIRRRVMKGKVILSLTLQLMIDYPKIHFMFCGNDGKKVCKNIFRRIL